MGFNRRKLEDQRREAANKRAAKWRLMGKTDALFPGGLDLLNGTMHPWG